MRWAHNDTVVVKRCHAEQSSIEFHVIGPGKHHGGTTLPFYGQCAAHYEFQAALLCAGVFTVVIVVVVVLVVVVVVVVVAAEHGHRSAIPAQAVCRSRYQSDWRTHVCVVVVGKRRDGG